jgi:hypothetical protein
MDDETKKRFSKEFNILETKNSLMEEPKRLNDDRISLGIGLPEVYRKIERERYSSIEIEDIQNRIDVLKAQEGADPEQIEFLEEMKMAAQAQFTADLDPFEKINGFKPVQDVVRDELMSIGTGMQNSLSNESLLTLRKQMESDPLRFRTEYPELFDYITSLKKVN